MTAEGKSKRSDSPPPSSDDVVGTRDAAADEPRPPAPDVAVAAKSDRAAETAGTAGDASGTKAEDVAVGAAAQPEAGRQEPAEGATGPAPAEVRDPRLDELEALKKERTEIGERLLRTAADFENFRKRTRRELEEAKQRGKDDALRELLPVFDNLERALRASGSAKDAGAVLEGVRMVLKLFEDTVQRMGLSRIPTVGERFDPAVHEALQQQETSEHTPGTIVAEVAPGYLFGKRLLRAAMVIVARRPAEAKAVVEAEAAEAESATERKPAVEAGAATEVPGADAGVKNGAGGADSTAATGEGANGAEPGAPSDAGAGSREGGGGADAAAASGGASR